MKVRRSRLDVLTILDYVDLHGADAASERYNVDARTPKRWAAKEPTGWQREEEVNRLLAVSKRIAGKVTYRDAVVGAGIATDKLWRQADRAARQALVVDEVEAAPNPIAAAVNRLDDRRKRLARDLIDAYASDLPEPDLDPVSDESLAAINVWIDQLLARSDDDLAAAEAAVKAELRAISERRSSVPVPRPSDQDPEPRVERMDAPAPIAAPQGQREPTLIDVGAPDRERHLWRRLDG